MFELIPFSTPTYWMNFSAHMAVSSGAAMGDVERACGRIWRTLMHIANDLKVRNALRHFCLTESAGRLGRSDVRCDPDLVWRLGCGGRASCLRCCKVS